MLLCVSIYLYVNAFSPMDTRLPYASAGLCVKLIWCVAETPE